MRRREQLLLLGLLLIATTGSSTLDPGSAGLEAYARGDYPTAERLFADAVRRNPREARVRYHRAVALTELGRWPEAVAEYENALRLNPSPEVEAASRQGLERVRPLVRAAPGRRAEPETVVGLERVAGGWVATVVVNDRRRARFLVDTGASISVVSPEFAEAAGIRAGRGARHLQLQTMAGRISAPLVTIPSLRVGDVEARDAPAVIHDVGLELDGILGNTFLDRYTITLDARRGALLMRGR